MNDREEYLKSIFNSVANALEAEGISDIDEHILALQAFSHLIYRIPGPSILGMVNILLCEAIERGMDVQFRHLTKGMPAPGTDTVN